MSPHSHDRSHRHDTHDASSIEAWFAGRLPEEWTAAGDATVEVDRDLVPAGLRLHHGLLGLREFFDGRSGQQLL